MKIQILGTGCKKCDELFENTKKAVAKKGIFVQIEKIEDVVEIMNYGVTSTPALVIDKEVKCSGRVLDEDSILKFL